MNINSMGGIGHAPQYNGMQRQAPNAEKMAEDLMLELDTNQQGYISQADMQSAVNNIEGSDSDMSAEALFSALDSDSDGQLTQTELVSAFEGMLAEMDVKMRANGNPPPPPPGGMEDQGFTQEQLSEMATNGDANDPMSEVFSQLASNFDEADANGDGKITHHEAMAFAGDEVPSTTGHAASWSRNER